MITEKTMNWGVLDDSDSVEPNSSLMVEKNAPINTTARLVIRMRRFMLGNRVFPIV